MPGRKAKVNQWGQGRLTDEHSESLPTQEIQKHLKATSQQESYRLLNGQETGKSGSLCARPALGGKKKFRVGREENVLLGSKLPEKKNIQAKAGSYQKKKKNVCSTKLQRNTMQMSKS